MEVIAPRSVPLMATQQRMVRYVEPGCPYRADDVMAPEKGVSTGTTIMAVVYDGGVVLGADSRTSTGDYVANRASRKISKVHDRIFVCRCGSAADTQALTGFVVNYLTQHAIEIGKPPTVNTAANLFKLIAYNNKDNLMAGLIVAGWDEKLGGQVYSIPLGGSVHKVPMACDGSGSGYISGFLDEYYRPGMTKEEALEFVRKGIQACGEKTKAWRWAIFLLNELKVHKLYLSAEAYNWAMHACFKGREWARAAELFDEMRNAEIVADEAVLDTMLLCCRDGAFWERAIAILEEQQGQQVDPTEKSYKAASEACAKARRDDWEEWVEDQAAMRGIFVEF